MPTNQDALQQLQNSWSQQIAQIKESAQNDGIDTSASIYNPDLPISPNVVVQNSAGAATGYVPYVPTVPSMPFQSPQLSDLISVDLKPDGGLDVKVPTILADNASFMEALKPALDTKVQYDANGQPYHALLQPDSIKLLDEYAAKAQKAQELATEYSNSQGYNSDQKQALTKDFVNAAFDAYKKDTEIPFKSFDTVGATAKKIFGADVSGIVKALGGSPTLSKLELTSPRTVTIGALVEGFNTLPDEAKKHYVDALKQDAADGDAVSARTLYALESQGAFKGDLQDAAEGFASGLQNNLVDFATNLVDTIPKTKNLLQGRGYTGGVFADVRDNNAKNNALTYTDAGRIGQNVGEIAALPIELAGLQLATPAVSGAIGNISSKVSDLVKLPSTLDKVISPIASLASKVGSINSSIETKFPRLSKYVLDTENALFALGNSDDSHDLVREIGQNLVFGTAFSGLGKAGAEVKNAFKARNIEALSKLVGDGTKGEEILLKAIDDLSSPTVANDTINALDNIASKTAKLDVPTDDVLDLVNRDITQNLQAQESLRSVATDVAQSGILAKLSDPAFDTNAEANFKFTQLFDRGHLNKAQELLDEIGVKNFNVQDVKNVQKFLHNILVKSGLDVGEISNHLSRSLYISPNSLITSGASKGTKIAAQQNKRVYKTVTEFLDKERTIHDVSVLRNTLQDSLQAIDVAIKKKGFEGLLHDGLVIKVNDNLGDDVFKIFRGTNGKTILNANAKTLTEKGFKEITNSEFKNYVGSVTQRYFASPANVAKIQEIYTRVPKVVTWFDDALTKAANTSKSLQNIVLAGGLPGTPLNNYAMREFINGVVAGNPKAAATAIAYAFSKDATNNYILNNLDHILRAAKDGAKFFSDDAIKALGGTVPDGIMKVTSDDGAINTIEALVDSTWFKGSMKNLPTTEQNKIIEAIKDAGNKLDDIVSDATFKRAIPIQQLETYKKLFNENLLKRGMNEGEASRSAIKAVNKFYQIHSLNEAALGIGSKFGANRGKKWLDILFLAPQYRKTMLTRVFGSIKALADPRIWADPARRAEHILSIRWGLSSIGLLLGLNAYSQLTEGKSSFDRGRPFDEIALHLGKNDYGIQILGSSVTIPKTVINAINNFSKGDTEKGLSALISTTSIMMQPILRSITDQDWKGTSIRNPEGKTDITPIEQWKNISKYIITQYSGHPYIRALEQFNRGNYFDAVTIGLESPINIRRLDRTAYAVFNGDVVNKARQLVLDYRNDINNSYQSPDRQKMLKEKVFQDIKKEVDKWVKTYGSYIGVTSSADLPDQMANKLLSLLIDSSFINTDGDTLQDRYTASLSDKGMFATRNAYKTLAKDIGLDLISNATGLRDIGYKAFGAPAEMRFRADELIKGGKDTGLESLWNIKKSYDNRISIAFDTKDYEAVAQLQAEYMQVYNDRIAPLVEAYGANAITANRELMNDLSDLIMVPSDFMQDSRGLYYAAGKYPNLEKKRGYARNYLKSMLGTGGGNTSNLPTDTEVTEQIASINNKIDAGRKASAKVQIDRLLAKIRAGKLYADPTSAKDILSILNNF